MKSAPLSKSARFLLHFTLASLTATCLLAMGLPSVDPTGTATPSATETAASPTPSLLATPTRSPEPTTEPTPGPSATAPVEAASSRPAPAPMVPVLDRPKPGENGAYMGMGSSRGGLARAYAGAVPMAASSWLPGFGVPGMDVSGHQPNIDWPAEAAKGAKFAYVKATEGIDIRSTSFSSQYTGSRNVGMVRGAYHFAWPGVTSATEQADYFVNNGGGWSADGWTLPPLLDVEYNPYGVFGNSCYNLSAGQMVAWIKEFSDRMLARTGRLPMIYSTTDWWRTCTGNNSSFGANGLHIAAYNTWGPEPLPAGWSDYRLWQFSDQGPFAGDSNIWNGSLAELKAFAVQSDEGRTVAVGDLNGDGRNDLVSVLGDGRLMFHAGSGDGRFAPAVPIGTGWQVYSKVIGSRDVNGDGRSDLLAVWADGSLWFYAGTGKVGQGNSGFAPGRVLGMGNWAQYSIISAAGDANSDGKNDLIATKPDGTLWLIPGLGTINSVGEAFGNPVKIGTSSWDSFSAISGAGDLNSDGIADVVASRPDGTLWFYQGTGAPVPSGNTYLPAVKIGTSGWNQFRDVLNAGDLNGDGKPDILGVRSDGVHYFYAGTGMRDNGYVAGRQIGGSGWNNFKQVSDAGDVDGDGVPDLLAIGYDGSLWHYAGDGAGGYKPRTAIGNSWDVYATVIGSGDLNGDSRPDLLAIRPDGTLWFYAGNGKTSSGATGYDPALKIGSYWNSFTDVIAVGDMNGDSKPDLLATRQDGSLWFYAGIGTVSATNNGFAAGKNLGVQDWVPGSKIVGSRDVNGDGRNDVLSVDAAGALWFREGTGTFATGTGTRAAVKIGGSGWDAYGSILGIGDANRDGRNDLVGINNNGSLWFYAGTGMKTGPLLGGVNQGVLR